MPKKNDYNDYMEKMDRILNNPKYLWTIHGSCFLGNGMTNPTLIQRPREDVLNDGKWMMVPIESRFKEVTPFIFKIKVAIMDLTSYKYLSCRRKCSLTNSCLAEFRSKQGAFEIFTMRFCFSEDGNHFAVFKSFNGFYLHYNETFHTGAFKACTARDENGLPVKGRWKLFDCSNGIPLMSGEKNTARQIVKKTAGTVINLAASLLSE